MDESIKWGVTGIPTGIPMADGINTTLMIATYVYREAVYISHYSTFGKLSGGFGVRKLGVIDNDNCNSGVWWRSDAG